MTTNLTRTITVTIGRNVGRVPMSEVSWNDFQLQVLDALEPLRKPDVDGKPTTWTETHFGLGSYEHVDGTLIVEESAKITMLDILSGEIEDIVRRLQWVAEEYGQEALAVATGMSFLAFTPTLQV